jgi:hypothetical protein
MFQRPAPDNETTQPGGDYRGYRICQVKAEYAPCNVQLRSAGAPALSTRAGSPPPVRCRAPRRAPAAQAGTTRTAPTAPRRSCTAKRNPGGSRAIRRVQPPVTSTEAPALVPVLPAPGSAHRHRRHVATRGPARPSGLALGHGWVEADQPPRACLIEFGDTRPGFHEIGE